jgi:rhamnose transport system permease protein
MTEAGMTATPREGGIGRTVGQLLRNRELVLVLIILVGGTLVAIPAPQFPLMGNLLPVAILASIYAVAGTGEALVIITRNIDLSVEAMIGMTAYCVAVVLEKHIYGPIGAVALGLGIGLVLGMVNGFLVAVLRVPAIVATLGTLSIFRGVDYVIAGPHQVPLAGLPTEFSSVADMKLFGVLPVFVIIAVVVVTFGTLVLRYTRFGRQVYAVGSNPEAASIMGIPSRRVEFIVFALCGLLAGLAGIMWVMFFGTINGTAATGILMSIIAAVVVGGVSTLGGSGTLAGAALGALFLGLTANALPLVGLSQFWLQAIYGLVILLAVSADAIILRRLQKAAAERSTR